MSCIWFLQANPKHRSIEILIILYLYWRWSIQINNWDWPRSTSTPLRPQIWARSIVSKQGRSVSAHGIESKSCLTLMATIRSSLSSTLTTMWSKHPQSIIANRCPLLSRRDSLFRQYQCNTIAQYRFLIYQFARRGKVLPVLSKYGKYLKTHRVFRQYIWAWLLPTTLLWTWADFEHIDNVEQLWKVHARRMQKQYQTI